MKMHADEVEVDEALVRRLLRAQFPEWADLPIDRLESSGTTNTIWRLGAELSVRLPRVGYGQYAVEKERRWLPVLAPRLPLEVPTPVAQGEPGERYPWSWSIHRWLPGEPATPEGLVDACQVAVDLAQFIRALRSIDPTGGPLAADRGLRGVPLSTLDTRTREGIAALAGEIDVVAATAVWEEALAAAPWEGDLVWFHGDLQWGNLLLENGRLKAVIDFGGLGVGEPTCDAMIAWGLFTGESRRVFGEALGLDDDAWRRARGHALYHGVIFIPYYRDTAPLGVAAARRLLAEVLASGTD